MAIPGRGEGVLSQCAAQGLVTWQVEGLWNWPEGVAPAFGLEDCEHQYRPLLATVPQPSLLCTVTRSWAPPSAPPSQDPMLPTRGWLSLDAPSSLSSVASMASVRDHLGHHL